ncbi:DUF1127 domain-containing protein [Pelagibacterium halotolerans]|uniref:YjiS-like domain-containing protein n=1 Tax=Pelagibacterium halotolerans (strain DSM 22347 / JCM 15775 / CGMCC 1.7692 / B2) TaxID=1082931 RepID=G4RGL6_PELHB|nr:DUF1127 domain-containing protein [Pelagibacterium halotolerans]AEQ51075.1 hypothetical protein KKY_1040 [Pelagibacterium halotolerans B2]QJR19042.1 DUF1127 domain-containing protein [Pelagibacterium halotolerans]SEA04054.1 protein of unknown function [Pelagibacterium halotolerans]
MTLYERDEFVERLQYRATVWRYLKLVVSGWWADRRARGARRRAMVELAEMEDWQLRDIGLERSEVDRLLNRHGMARDQVKALEAR